MKIIFLDVDGVLNCSTTTEKCFGSNGIDSDKVKILKNIVDMTGAHIYLISDWKERWFKDISMKYRQDIFAEYLDEKLEEEGLYIEDKLDGSSYERGYYITQLQKIIQFENFVILDDCYQDYSLFGLDKHFIQTDSKYGLTEKDGLLAVNILNNLNNI